MKSKSASLLCGFWKAPSRRAFVWTHAQLLHYLFSNYRNNHQLCCLPVAPQKERSENFVFKRHSQRLLIPSFVPGVLPVLLGLGSSLDTSFRASSDRGIQRVVQESAHLQLLRACVAAIQAVYTTTNAHMACSATKGLPGQDLITSGQGGSKVNFCPFCQRESVGQHQVSGAEGQKPYFCTKKMFSQLHSCMQAVRVHCNEHLKIWGVDIIGFGWKPSDDGEVSIRSPSFWQYRHWSL